MKHKKAASFLVFLTIFGLINLLAMRLNYSNLEAERFIAMAEAERQATVKQSKYLLLSAIPPQ